jgi:hypothetical protein
LPLHIKLEAFLFHISKHFLEDDLLETLNLPSNSAFSKEIEELMWISDNVYVQDSSPMITVNRRMSMNVRSYISDSMSLSIRINGKMIVFEKQPEPEPEKTQENTEEKTNTLTETINGLDGEELADNIIESAEII